MQTEQGPAGIFEIVKLFLKRSWKLSPSECILECGVDIERASNELPGANALTIKQLDASRATAFDDYLRYLTLWGERSAEFDKPLHDSAGKVERATSAELISRL